MGDRCSATVYPEGKDPIRCSYPEHFGPHSFEEGNDPGRLQELDGMNVSREAVMREEGHKDDFGKTNFFAMPWLSVTEAADVMTFGAKKYAMFNFRKGMKYSRLWSAALRHMVAWWRGEENDPESGENHLAHAICCLTMLREVQILERGEDDRDK
jgi:hypothetical protein